MAHHPPDRSRLNGVLAGGLFGLTMAESATTTIAAIAGRLSFAVAVGTFTGDLRQTPGDGPGPGHRPSPRRRPRP